MSTQEINQALEEIQTAIESSRPMLTIGQMQKQLEDLLFDGISDHVDYTLPDVWIRANYRKSMVDFKRFEREVWIVQMEFEYGCPDRDKKALFAIEDATSVADAFAKLTENVQVFIAKIQTEYPHGN